MIEYIIAVNTTFITCAILYGYYRVNKIFYIVSNIVMDSEILDQLVEVEAKITKPKKSRAKKAQKEPVDNVDNGSVDNEKRDRLIQCVLSGNSKQYLGKEYTEKQINEMDSDTIDSLTTRYEAFLSSQMTKSLGKSIINLYSNITCNILKMDKSCELSDDLEQDPFLNTALQRLTCDMYYRFGEFLAPVSVAMITGRHYTKYSTPKLVNNDRSTSSTAGTSKSSTSSTTGTSKSSTNCSKDNKTEESSKS